MLTFFILLGLVIAVESTSVHPKSQQAFESMPLQSDGRIVGGHNTSIFKHPYQISLRYRRCDTCAYGHICGGSVYTESIIITAAHCVNSRKSKSFIIVAGTETRNGTDGVVALVDKIVRHELFTTAIAGNDVALIFLRTPLPIDRKTIATISLAAAQPHNGIKSYVTGWGTIIQGGDSSFKLLEVEIPIVSNERCNEAYGKGNITDSMLCAGAVGGGKDSCQGDSGGPLIVKGQLAGIVSWGRGCGRPDFPGVYANVAYLKKWIEKATMEGT